MRVACVVNGLPVDAYPKGLSLTDGESATLGPLFNGTTSGLVTRSGASARRAMEEAPDAEQGASYGKPALWFGGKPLLGFRAATKHLAVYPFSPTAVDAVRDQL